jgi:hypothetical protein
MIQIQTRNTAILITTLLLSTISIGITYTETVTAQTNNNMTSGSTQNQTDEFEV